MKKQILTLLAVVSLGFAAQAQVAFAVEEVQYQSQTEKPSFGFAQGNIFVEGSLGYSTSDDKNTKLKGHEFNLTPQVGYFVTDKFAAGVYFDLMTSKDDNYSGVKDITKTNNFNVGVFGRYYFLELGQRFKFYGQANVGFAHTKTTLESPGSKVDIKGSGVNVGLDLGLNYFVTKNIAVNFAFADLVDYTTTKPKGGKAQNDVNVELNSFKNFFDQPRFGLTFVF